MLLEVFLAKQPSLISCMVGRMAAAYQPLPPGGWGCHQPLSGLCCGGARACLAAALLGAEATGRARLDGLLSYSPLVNGEKEETGLIQEVTSSPKGWMRGLNATLGGLPWWFSG